MQPIIRVQRPHLTWLRRLSRRSPTSRHSPGESLPQWVCRRSLNALIRSELWGSRGAASATVISQAANRVWPGDDPELWWAGPRRRRMAQEPPLLLLLGRERTANPSIYADYCVVITTPTRGRLRTHPFLD